MAESLKVVAVLAANPALSSILSMVLAGARGLRVRLFESQAALTAYMRVAPVDLVVADLDSREARADRLARALRGDENLCRRDFDIIALTRSFTKETGTALTDAGINEVIVKPMSPRYLLERVTSRVSSKSRSSEVRRGAYRYERRSPAKPRTDNVIPLFGERPRQPMH